MRAGERVHLWSGRAVCAGQIYTDGMPRTDTATRIVPADVSRTFEALTSKEALEEWLPPAGMTGSIEDFNAAEGGGYRMTLTYPTELAGQGKTTADTDVVNVRYTKIIADESVTQEGSF